MNIVATGDQILEQVGVTSFGLTFCPMPPEGTDLSQTQLSREQRLWLGQVILSRRYKARDLANKWNLKYSLVRTYSYRLSKGRIPAERTGRPRVIDVQGLDFLRTVVQVDGIRDRDALIPPANEAHTESYKRRRCVIENVENVSLVMKKRTRTRYIGIAKWPEQLMFNLNL